MGTLLIYLKNKWVAIGLIVLISAVVYYNSLNVPFIFDDIPKIVENPDIKKLDNIKTKLIYPYKEYKTFKRNDPSRPLTYLTFTLNYHFGKLNPFGYHLFNILIHIFNGVLIFLFTREIILHTYKKDSIVFSLFVSLFFAVHPVNTAVVTYIYSRSGQLATLFYILSLLFFIKAFESNRNLYIFSILCFFLSLSSKPIAVTFPAVVLIFDYIFLSDFEIEKVSKKKYYHIPFWMIFFIYILFRHFYLGDIGDIESSTPVVGSNYSYMITQLNIIIRYLGSLIVPTGLYIDYAIPLAKTIFEPRILVSVFFYIGLIFLIWKMYKVKNNVSKIILFCIIWFFIILSPTSSFIPTSIPMDDKRLYLSGFGFHLAVVFMYFLIFCRGKPFEQHYSCVLYVLMIIHISVLGIATVKRNRLYQDPVLLWQDVISRYPKNLRAYDILVGLYEGQQEYTKAIQVYKNALKIGPDCIKIHFNLGHMYIDQKEYAKAIQKFQKVLEINPNYAEAHNSIGNIYVNQGEYTKAIQEFQKAIEANPDYAEAHNNLGNLWYIQKEYTKAISEYQKVLEINPNLAMTHYNLGVLYETQQEYDKAIQEYKKALEIKPDYIKARNSLNDLYRDIKK